MNKLLKKECGKLMLGNDGYGEARLLSVKVTGDVVRFREECDRYFDNEVSKSEAIEILNDMIKYIKES